MRRVHKLYKSEQNEMLKDSPMNGEEFRRILGRYDTGERFKIVDKMSVRMHVPIAFNIWP